MNKNRLPWLLAVLLIFTLSSCNFPTAQATPDQNEIQTMVSLRVEQTQIAATMAALQPFVTPTLLPGQPTPLPPTETLTPTVTLTPEPTLTPTPSGVWLTINANTNCRTGPASYYRLVLSLKAGDQVEATGINPNSDYYYVVNPTDANSYCWVWNRYATITGNPSILPVYTPQPTATPTSTPTIAPDFNFSYISLNNCGGQYSIKIRVRNTGSLTWKSIRMVVKDNTSATTFTHTSDNFSSYDGCTVEVDQKDLTFGEEGLVTNYNPGQLGYDPTGHALTITVTLFSADGRTGTSLSRSINIAP